MTWLAIKALLGGVSWRTWAIGAAAAFAVWFHFSARDAAYERGRSAYKAEIEAANKESERKADDSEKPLHACPLGKWDRRLGKCVE